MIRWFDDVQASDTAVVGGKGANLGECTRAGLPVPGGFCITTQAYRQATAAISGQLTASAEQGDAKNARRLVREVPLPHAVRTAITTAYARLGEPAVAVRSSATAEDLAEASFAGQQDTYLGVVGVADLLDAVQRCWASLWTDRAVAYRAQHAVPHEGLALAVVVQEMVAPEVAGVLFTRDPVTGDDAQMLVSASYGLGESVVAALVTPDNFTLRRVPAAIVHRQLGTKQTRIDAEPGGGTVSTEVPEADRDRFCVADAHLLRLAGLGEQVEAHYGTGQDIEWAITDDRVYLLQARPITTSASTGPAHAPVRGRVARALRDDLIEHYPAPYPLDLHAVHRIQDVLQALMRELGAKAPTSSSLVVGDADGIITTAVTAPRPTPAMLIRAPRFVRTVLRHDPELWPVEQRPLRASWQALSQRAAALPTGSDAEALDLMSAALDAAAQITRDRFVDYLAPMMVHRRTALSLIKKAGLSADVTPEDVYAGLPYVTAEVTRGLDDLAGLARRSGVRDVIVGDPKSAPEALTRSPEGTEFLAAVTSFLASYGARTARMYVPFSSRSWREDPATLYALLAGILSTDTDHGSSVPDAIERVSARLPGRARRRWRKTVDALRPMHVAREATVYWIEEFLVLARMASDEVAARLVARGQLDQPADIRFCYLDEVTRALENADHVLTGTVARRRRRRGAAEAIWWDRGGQADDADGWKGVPASGGRATGTARIVHGPADFGRLQPGDVLVCPYTDPTWTPLFSVATAVVADTGGPLSHAAIVAREYAIPAVLGVQHATATIPDGATITVDGTAGTITAHS